MSRRVVVAAIVVGLLSAACSSGGHPRAQRSVDRPTATPRVVPSASGPSPGVTALPPGVNAMVGTDPYPFGVTSAFDRVWVTAKDGYSVDVVDPVTGQLVRTVGLDVQPGSVVSGGGSIWVQSRTDNTIVRLDPSTYATTTLDLAGAGDMSCSIAFGQGRLWAATATDTSGTVFEIRPSDGAVVAAFPVKGFPCSWASLDGGEWTVAGRALVELLPGRKTPRIVPVPRFRNGDLWLAGAAGGRLYVIGGDGVYGSRLFRVDPSGRVDDVLHRPTDELITLNVGEAGLWFASDGTDLVLVVDPRTMRVRARGTLSTGEVVPDPTMPLDQLWLPDSPDTAVVNIDPGAFLRTPD